VIGTGEIDKIMDLLEKDLETLTNLRNTVNNTKYKTPVLMRSLEDINPALVPGNPGWPRFKRSEKTRDYVKIVNLKEVKDWRAAREEWAAEQRRLRGSP
jgi:hypothetical protein